MIEKPPLFIVGVPRSGTTLLAAMLASHSRLSCGPETHFFRWLSKTDPDHLRRAESWPKAAADFLSSITYRNFSTDEVRPLIEKYEQPPEALIAFLENREPSIKNILASITEPYMRAREKSRWAEKTPDHLKHVALIRAHFPTSPIIRIIRDPRDVGLSIRKVPWGAQSLLEALQFWQSWDEASFKFFSSDPLAFTLRYEDLLGSPENTIRSLCSFIDEPYEPTMLDTSAAGRLVNTRNSPWKAKASQPIDASRIGVWQRELTPDEIGLAEAILGDSLDSYGYPRIKKFHTYSEIFPSIHDPGKFEKSLTFVANTGIRFWPASANEIPSGKIFLGAPDQGWLGSNKSLRTMNALTLSGQIIKATTLRKSIFWIPDPDQTAWSGIAASLLEKLLTPHKVELEPEDRELAPS